MGAASVGDQRTVFICRRWYKDGVGHKVLRSTHYRATLPDTLVRWNADSSEGDRLATNLGQL